MIDSDIKASLSDTEKLISPREQVYLPGVHPNKRVDAQIAARRKQEAELAKKTGESIAEIKDTIHKIEAAPQPTAIPEEPRITFPEPTKKKWTLRSLFGRN